MDSGNTTWEYSIQKNAPEKFPQALRKNHESVDPRALAALQQHFEKLVWGGAGCLLVEGEIAFPDLELLAAHSGLVLWCPIAGMMGGFRVEFLRYGVDPRLRVDNWSRMGGGTDRELSSRGVETENDWSSLEVM